jgi:hypothetical protein
VASRFQSDTQAELQKFLGIKATGFKSRQRLGI